MSEASALPLRRTVENNPNTISREIDRPACGGGNDPLSTRSSDLRGVLQSVGRAAGIAMLLDGGLAAVEAAAALNQGTASFEEAVAHVAKEGVTSAVATGFGVLVASGVVGITGGLAAPVAGTIAVGTALTARKWIRDIIAGPRARRRSAPPQIPRGPP